MLRMERDAVAWRWSGLGDLVTLAQPGEGGYEG